MLYTPPNLPDNTFRTEDGTTYYRTSAPVSTITLNHKLRRFPDLEVYDVASENPVIVKVTQLDANSTQVDINMPLQLLITLT